MPAQPDNYQRIQNRKAMAPKLLQRADRLCSSLFSAGDLTGFLSLLCRLHNYDYRNLLLIYDQYPTATCLGTFQAWKSMLPDPSGMVLKKDAVGKGIELLASFTEYSNPSYLIWYQVSQFDVSQTNVSYCPDLFAPYAQSMSHPQRLFESVRAALAYLFQRSLLLVPQGDPAVPAQLRFYITREAVAIRKNTSVVDRILLLAEAISELSAKQSTLPEPTHRLFCSCLCHCLLTIWQYPEVCPAPRPGAQITAVPDMIRAQFLDTLQQSVRQINETVACGYHFLQRDTNDLSSDQALYDVWDFPSDLSSKQI